MANAHTKIKQGMRRNEVEILARLRNNGRFDTYWFSKSWWNALDRLLAAGRVEYSGGAYFAHKGAGPVTPAVRP